MKSRLTGLTCEMQCIYKVDVAKSTDRLNEPKSLMYKEVDDYEKIADPELSLSACLDHVSG